MSTNIDSQLSRHFGGYLSASGWDSPSVPVNTMGLHLVVCVQEQCFMVTRR